MELMERATVTMQRRAPRYMTYLDARLCESEIEQKGVVLSISGGGLFLATEFRAAPGKKLKISLTDPDGDELEVEGLVIYRSVCQGHEGLGVKFLAPNATAELIESIRFWFQQYIGLR